ncbi:MAG: hypothetical protein LBP62_04470 [Clostridiales bacterium]|jgi:hypothetical protein|nr:hypothetical protein [Clostridiales bacterium]
MENAKNVTLKPESERLLSIDRFRGLLLFLNAVGYMIGAFASITVRLPFLNSANGKMFEVLRGVPFDDIFLPLFVFVMGLTACGSFKKVSDRFGPTAAMKKFGLKYLILIGFGTVSLDAIAITYEMVAEKTAFSDLFIAYRLVLILFFVFIALALIYFVTKIIKKPKLTKIVSGCIKAIWAAGGAVTVFFLVRTSGFLITGENPIEIMDVFQTIGLAALFALPFMGLNKWGKLTAALVFGFILTTFYGYGGLDGFGNEVFNGGFIGGMGWAIPVLLGGYFKDIKDKRILYWISCALCIAVPLILVYKFNFIAERRGGTPVYTLFASGLGAAIWGGFNLLSKVYNPKRSFLSVWGGSSILTYSLSIIISTLLGAFASGLPIVAAVSVAVIIVAGLFFLNFSLIKKGIHIKI